MRVGAGTAWLETQDVLVQPERDPLTAAEGAIYRVELGSFPTESAASDFRARAAEEIEDDLSTERVALTGRYAVRAGKFETEAGAAESLRELERRGFEGTSVVREPTFSVRATGFLLIGAGAPLLRVASQELRAAAPAGALIELDGKPYRGYLEIALNGSGSLTVTNVVNLEDYLMGVVPAELSPDAFPEKEALKAQAIAARTYAVKRLGQYASEGYDICATPACQVYRGYAAERPLSNAAVAETAGEVLTFDGKMVDALYTSTCGGRTENAENVFSQKEPYLVSRACALESRAPLLVSSGDGPSTLEAAILRRVGIRGDFDESGPASSSEARLWLDTTLRALGETPCWREPEGSGGKALDLLAFAELLGEGLCWERRLPFLLSSPDAERIVGREFGASDAPRLAIAINWRRTAQARRRGESLARETFWTSAVVASESQRSGKDASKASKRDGSP
jgi:hypothetical protein